MGKKILVTGGAGFIGSNFIRLILSRRKPETEIVNLDSLTYAADLRSLKDFAKDPRYSFIKGDICDSALVDKLARDCDWIVNFAAETHVDNSISAPEDFMKTNVLGTHVLLKSALRHGVSKFLQVSTDEVYGSIDRGRFAEKSVLSPSSPYSASKAGAEHIVFAYHQTFGMPVLVTRSSNNFGPFQHPEKLIPKIITHAARGKKIPIYARGLNRRDWIMVEDNCRGIETVLLKGKAGEAYNIGAGNEHSNLSVVKMILKKMGRPESLMQFVKDRPGHDFSYAVDTKKVRGLGWRPKASFGRALDYTVDWYLQNEWWWKSKGSSS